MVADQVGTYEAFRASLIEKYGGIRLQSPDFPDHCPAAGDCPAVAWRHEILFVDGHAVVSRCCADGHYEIMEMN